MPVPTTSFKYLPAYMVRLLIRLEDFTQSVDLDAQREDQPPPDKAKTLHKRIAQKAKDQAEASAEGDTVTAQQLDVQLKKLRRDEKKLKTQQRPTGVPTEKGDAFSVEVVTAPMQCGVERNGPKMGDKANLTIPFRDAPLPEQCIRACLLEVFAGTVAAETFADPARWKLPLDRSNLVFRGYVDQWECKHDGEDEMIQIQARSLEGILRDAKIAPLAKVYQIKGKEESIVDYCNRILSLFPATSGLHGDGLRCVMFRAAAAPMINRKLLHRSLQTTQSQNQGVPQGQTGVSGLDQQASVPAGQEQGTGTPQIAPPTTTMDVWDLLTVACRIVSLQPIYDPTLDPQIGEPLRAGDFGPKPPGAGDVILLCPPNTLYDKIGGGIAVQGGPRDQFQRTFFDPATGKSVSSDLRVFVWGRNISEVKSARKFGRHKVPAVEVISYNEDAPPLERVIRVRYPDPKSIRATTLNAKGAGAREEIITRTVNGIRDKVQLQQIALGLYHQVARQELTIHLKLDSLASYIDPLNPLSDNGNPDVLKLSPGTPVRILVARQTQDPNDPRFTLTSLSEIFERRTTELREWLKTQNDRFRPDLDPDDSLMLVDRQYDAIATSIKSSRMTDVFYVRSVHHQFSADDGWSADVEVMNFLEVRSLPKNLSELAKTIDDVQRIGNLAVEKVAIGLKTLEQFAARLADIQGQRGGG